MVFFVISEVLTVCYQVYNYLEKTARVVFGPDLVILGPHENFNVLSLSGESMIRSEYLKDVGTRLSSPVLNLPINRTNIGSFLELSSSFYLNVYYSYVPVTCA